MGKALEARASRKAWVDVGRPIQAEVRSAFDRDQAERDRWEQRISEAQQLSIRRAFGERPA
jgi:hypothetical protein